MSARCVVGEVLNTDGISGLASLDSGSVDLLLSDLPSGETAAKFDIKPDLSQFWSATWHALKPDGIAVLMASSFRFAAELRESSLPEFRYDLICEKSLPTGFFSAGSRPLRSHEFVLIFWHEPGAYNPQMVTGATPISSNRRMASTDPMRPSNGVNYGNSTVMTKSRAGELERYPASVLHFGGVGTADPLRTHPQQKPESLLANLVRQYSNSGDLVADPFSGSGTTGRAALDEGRRFIGWESNEDFCAAANKRLSQQSIWTAANV